MSAERALVGGWRGKPRSNVGWTIPARGRRRKAESHVLDMLQSLVVDG